MASRAELQAILEKKSPQELDELLRHPHVPGVSVTSGTDRHQRTIRGLLDLADAKPRTNLALHRALGVPTSEEWAIQLAERATSVAEKSAASSKSSKQAAWISAILAASALVFSAAVYFWGREPRSATLPSSQPVASSPASTRPVGVSAVW